MKRLIIFCAAIMVIMCVRTTPVHAFGLGLLGNFNGGKMIGNGFGADFMNYGGGLVLDTNLAGNQVFNYRLELSFTNLHSAYQVEEINLIPTLLLRLPFYTTAKYYEDSFCMTTVHYFGFGVVRTKKVRFWLGPQITFGGMLTNLKGVYAGFGFAMGLNINIGDIFTLSFVGAGRFLGGAVFYTNAQGGTEAEGRYGGDGMTTVAFIFRIPGDKY